MISQSYYYVTAVVGVGLLLGGVIAALLGLRQWIFPASPDIPDLPFVEGGSDEAIRSVLGGLAFAIPGGLTFWWHLREARRRESATIPRVFWGSALYFHLVAFLALMIAVGGVIATLHALIDVAVPSCFEAPSDLVIDPNAFPSAAPPGYEPLPSEGMLVEAIRQCYPPSSVALRTALDGLIVAGVAGATWAWHLRRGRRLTAPPTDAEPAPSGAPA